MVKIDSQDMTFTARAKRLPVAAIAAVVVIALLESFLYANRYRLVDGIEANLMTKRAMLENSQSPDDVAIFGDSKLFSMVPKKVSEALGGRLRVTNYSWPLMGIEGYEAMLSNYLRHKEAPDFIIINARVEMIAAPEHRNSLADYPPHRARAFVALPLREIFAVAVAGNKWSLLWHRLSYALLPPSAAWSETAWEAMRDLPRGRGWPEPDDDYVRMTESFKSTGAFMMYRKRQTSDAEIAGLEKVEGPYAVHDNVPQIASFKRFLARAADEEINVIMVGVPAPPVYFQRLDQLGIYSAYRDMVNGWRNQFPNFHVAEPLFPVYPIENFGDPGHINNQGDALFQADYTSALQRVKEQLK